METLTSVVISHHETFMVSKEERDHSNVTFVRMWKRDILHFNLIRKKEGNTYIGGNLSPRDCYGKHGGERP